ncbi:hypothetical protein Ae201684_001021 [Aphanomyces euteiches]|uniref:PWWP domain-containing protein n=1 Tax=Aphanomyces euteiches TaxID=100861 RepID=A0A6G0XVN2_9STRA|nr:hypothetical protein Ae201684_001021 [Aphanomyces euteiches]
MNSAPNVEVNQVAWAKSEDNPWWPVYICDPSKLRTELHLLGSGHRRMLRKANERPTERYLAFYFGLYLFRLHAHDDNTLRPWECIGHAEFVHGLPKIKRGPVQDSFRTALREARTYLASDETTRLPPRMVASDLDPSMSPPALKSSVVAATTGTTEVIDIDSDENEEAINNSSVVQVTADDLKYDSLAWLYVVGKTWWPAYICDPKILQSHSRVSNSRTKVVRLAKEFTTEIQIAQSSSDTHRLLYLFGTHTLHLHDTTTKFADTGIKIWNCNEYDQYFPNKTWSRKDEAHARAMKEVKDFLACQNSIRLPPYISSNVFAPKASNLTPGPQESNANESKQLQSTQISDESGHEELAITRNTKRTDNEVADDVNSMDAHPKGQVHDLPPESNTTITSQEFSRPILSESMSISQSDDEISGFQGYVAWACLNGQMWWPVYVCAMDFESKRDAREHEVSKHRGGLSQRKDIVAQVYFFGRHKFGLIESESLKQWKGAQHTDLIYDQSFVESKSKAFVEAFAAAVAEAENFEVAYQHLLQPFIPPTSKENIKDVSTNISGPQSGDDKDEPPRKKQAVEVPQSVNEYPPKLDASRQSSLLVSELTVLKNKVHEAVPVWKQALTTGHVEHFLQVIMSLQRILNQLYVVLRHQTLDPTIASRPLQFVSVYHCAVMCLWCLLISVSVKNSGPATSPEAQFMHKCMKNLLGAFEGPFEPQVHEKIIQDCVSFSNEITQFSVMGLKPDVDRARRWLLFFLNHYLSEPASYCKCRSLDFSTRDQVSPQVLPNALKVEFAKLSVMQREFESRTQDSSKSQNVAHTPGPEIQDVSVVSPQTVPHVDSNQYGVDTTFTFETYSLGLHIGETKHGAVVLGLASNAPQQTKYAIEWGTIAPGDFIAKVNSRPYTEIGYKGFSDLVASGKRPLSVTFRRPVRNPIVSHDKPKSATPSASRSNANNKATSQRVTLIEEVTPQERPNVNGFEHRVSTNDYESQFSGRSSVSVRSSYATPFIASTNCTSNPSTSSQHNRRLVNTNQASQNLVASSAMPTPSTSMNYYDVSSNIGNLQSVANTQIFPTFLGGGSTNQVGQPPFSHIPFSPQVPPTAAGNDAVFFNPSNVPALGYHGNYGNQAPYFPPQSVMIVAVPPGHPLYNSMLLQSLPTYPAPPELPPQYQNHNPSYFNYPPSNGFFP